MRMSVFNSLSHTKENCTYYRRRTSAYRPALRGQNEKAPFMDAVPLCG